MTVYEYKGLKINTDELSEEDMPNNVFKEIFTLCGADTAISLLLYMTGNLILVPASGGMAKIEEKIIRKMYDGTTDSIRAICRKFSVSETYVRSILKKNKNLKDDIPLEGQLSFRLAHKN